MALICLAVITLLAPVVSGAAFQIPLSDGNTDATFEASNGIGQSAAIPGLTLINAYPMGKPCYSKPDPVDQRECDAVTARKTNDTFIIEQPGGHFYGNWASCQAEKQNCALPLTHPRDKVDPNRRCHQGGVPDQMAPVKRVEDVQTVFAAANLGNTKPLVIKNTGHDWKGRSAGPGSLAIWTRRWPTDMALHKGFRPKQCDKQYSDAVISFGPGAVWGDVYKFARQKGYSVVGGTCPTVGVVGWLHGGGHSPITPIYGMGVDNVQQIEIVTPDGTRRIANECIEKDLFFAVRGGGGGTWGVVTRVWYKAWKRIPVFEFSASIGNRTMAERLNFTKIITKNAVNWSQQGWGGYFKPSSDNDTVEMVNSATGINNATATLQMKELLDFLKRINITPKFRPVDSWEHYIEAHMAPTTHHIGSWSLLPAARLLPKQLFIDHETLAEDLSSVYKQDNITLWLMMVTPTTYNHTTTSALHPSWKTAIMSARANTKWDQYENDDSLGHLKKLHNAFKIIRDKTPGMGVSISETEIWEPHHQDAFWGRANYNKLLGIKKRFDPRNILSVWHGVGYKENDSRFKCYPRI